MLEEKEGASRIKNDNIHVELTKERLSHSFNDVGFVRHAAATKIVRTDEHIPFECAKANGACVMDLIDICTDRMFYGPAEDAQGRPVSWVRSALSW